MCDSYVDSNCCSFTVRAKHVTTWSQHLAMFSADARQIVLCRYLIMYTFYILLNDNLNDNLARLDVTFIGFTHFTRFCYVTWTLPCTKQTRDSLPPHVQVQISIHGWQQYYLLEIYTGVHISLVCIFLTNDSIQFIAPLLHSNPTLNTAKGKRKQRR